ncbi:cyclic pyranopterin monophosphate synthase MoaC [Gordonia sp. VNQ95]|uniref:cyclic pyranopterin monophosphate synthase MoaC n=1 Tax=Gordonia TaxID=2053 RepID=UPI0032B3A74E
MTDVDPDGSRPTDRLSHVDDSGAARMVDVGDKPPTRRRAVAGGTFRTTRRVIDLLTSSSLPKGDVLATARIAGIMAAKRTDSLIPLCHQLSLSSVDVDFVIGEDTIDVTATVTTAGPTGVEMEALTAVAVSGLTLHDMVKAVDRHAQMDAIRLLAKFGGRSGDWTRDGVGPDTVTPDTVTPDTVTPDTGTDDPASDR